MTDGDGLATARGGRGDLDALPLFERLARLKALASLLGSGAEALTGIAAEAKRTFPGGRLCDGRDLLTAHRGVAVLIDAGESRRSPLLVQFACAFVAGMPVVVDLARTTSPAARRLVEAIATAGVLPLGALYAIDRGDDLLEQVCANDVVWFSGPPAASRALASHSAIVRSGARLYAQSETPLVRVLGPDARDGTPEFELFVRASACGEAPARAFVPHASFGVLEAELARSAPATTVLTAYESSSEVAAVLFSAEQTVAAALFTYDDGVVNEMVSAIASTCETIAIVDRDDAQAVRIEAGALRSIYRYLNRTVLSGSPERMTRISGTWSRGAREQTRPRHPFRYRFDEIAIGQTLHTAARTITLEDIEHFADFTGDRFYAHMDDAAAKANPFFPGRVAHGYLLLSFAAGLFVDAAPGPVLANTGLENLRFTKPVSPGDSIRVRLTAAAKIPRRADYGEVRWDVEIVNQRDESVATYELLTMVRSAMP